MRFISAFFFSSVIVISIAFAQDSSSSSSVLVQSSSSSDDSSSSNEANSSDAGSSQSSSEASSSDSSSSSSESSADSSSSESSSDSSSSEPPLEPIPMPEYQTCEEERDSAYEYCVERTEPNTPDRIDCEIQRVEYDELYCPCRAEPPAEWCGDECEEGYIACEIAAAGDYEKCLLEGTPQATCLARYNDAIFNPITQSGCGPDYQRCINPPPPPPQYLACEESSSSSASFASSSSCSSAYSSSSSSSSYSSDA